MKLPISLFLAHKCGYNLHFVYSRGRDGRTSNPDNCKPRYAGAFAIRPDFLQLIDHPFRRSKLNPAQRASSATLVMQQRLAQQQTPHDGLCPNEGSNATFPERRMSRPFVTATNHSLEVPAYFEIVY